MNDRTKKLLELAVAEFHGDKLTSNPKDNEGIYTIKYYNYVHLRFVNYYLFIDVPSGTTALLVNYETFENQESNTVTCETYEICYSVDTVVNEQYEHNNGDGAVDISPLTMRQNEHQDDIAAEEIFEEDSDDSVNDKNYSSSETQLCSSSDSKEVIEHKKTRKRLKHSDSWKCNSRKKRRADGKEYVSKTGKRVAERKLKEACKKTCKLKCSEKINEKYRLNILQEFWSNEKSIDQKRQFVASSIKTDPIKRTRERTGDRRDKRQFTNHYFLVIEGRHVNVCKTFFLNTLNISQTFVSTALQKREIGGVVSRDERGRHEPPNKIAEYVKDSVRNHILKFPTEESHYSRSQSSKKYLGSHLNISRMYELYKRECDDLNVPEQEIAKSWLYNDIFNKEFNYSFQAPVNDTCDECDHYFVQLKDTSLSPENKLSIQSDYEAHLNEAKARYNLKKIDKEQSRNSNKERVIMVDLEKCLPTPLLTNAQSFYALKLWTFNYTIRDSTTNKSFCCMWDESVAGRGGNEMASCLIKWIVTSNFPNYLHTLTIWSDNCPSQNRNMNMVMCYFYIIKIMPTLKVINHKFLLRGHTHLEVDCDHSLIEREKKKMPNFSIMIPWDWQQLVRIASARNPFTVINMDIEDFKNLKCLMEQGDSPFQIKKKSKNGNNFLISKIIHFQVRSEEPNILYFKKSFDDDFDEIDLSRNTRRAQFPDKLPPVRDDAKPISTKKFKSLQTLLPWIPKMFHPFYKNLAHRDAKNADDD